MAPQAVDEALAALAEVVQEVVTGWRAAERELEEIDEVQEQRIERRQGRPRPPGPDPAAALERIRWELAREATNGHRRAARELAAWWADLATAALLTTVYDKPLHPVRAAAGDPTIAMDDHEQQQLPGPSQFDRDLVRLTALLGRPPETPAPDNDDDLAPAEVAARTGMRLATGDDGDLTVMDDPMPEGRRRRLWGENWTDHQVPLLPPAGELADLLTQHSVPTEVVTDIQQATTAVGQALTASHRLRDVDTDLRVEFDALWEQADQLTDLLAGYAQMITDHLPAIRAATQRAP